LAIDEVTIYYYQQLILALLFYVPVDISRRCEGPRRASREAGYGREIGLLGPGGRGGSAAQSRAAPWAVRQAGSGGEGALEIQRWRESGGGKAVEGKAYPR